MSVAVTVIAVNVVWGQRAAQHVRGPIYYSLLYQVDIRTTSKQSTEQDYRVAFGDNMLSKMLTK